VTTAPLRFALPTIGLAVVLTACGGSGAAPAADTGAGTAAPAATAASDPTASDPTTAVVVDEAHNDADITFAQGMIPHHEQALQMSEMALAAAEDEQVRALAEEIAGAQEPEIALMRTMLDTWGADQPEPLGGMGDGDMDHGDMDHGDMDHGDMGADGMSGMMSQEDMASLGEAEGAAFDRMWLTMMIEHHEGAVEMAEAELAEGQNPQATALAEDVVRVQQDEIRRMQDLLAG
jgi:uncharacterized protein (DUF305 family)